jgi:hypothetical protein
MIAKLASRDTQTVASALIRQARKLPDELYKSLTWDRGPELADHKQFSMETDIDVYPTACCASTFPKVLIWRRTRKPKLNKVARQLNERLRKTLDFQSRQSELASVLRRPVEVAASLSRSNAMAGYGRTELTSPSTAYPDKAGNGPYRTWLGSQQDLPKRVARLDPETFENDGRRAEASERGLQHVGAGKGGQPQPGRVDEPGQRQACQNDEAGKREHRAVECHKDLLQAENDSAGARICS